MGLAVESQCNACRIRKLDRLDIVGSSRLEARAVKAGELRVRVISPRQTRVSTASLPRFLSGTSFLA